VFLVFAIYTAIVCNVPPEICSLYADPSYWSYIVRPDCPSTPADHHTPSYLTCNVLFAPSNSKYLCVKLDMSLFFNGILKLASLSKNNCETLFISKENPSPAPV